MSTTTPDSLEEWNLLNKMEHRELQQEEVLRTHKDEKGYNCCWLDDIELYKTLPEGTFGIDLTLPPREEFLKNCEVPRSQTKIQVTFEFKNDKVS